MCLNILVFNAGGATLVFDTELIAINGVTEDPAAKAQELK